MNETEKTVKLRKPDPEEIQYIMVSRLDGHWETIHTNGTSTSFPISLIRGLVHIDPCPKKHQPYLSEGTTMGIRMSHGWVKATVLDGSATYKIRLH